MRPRVLILSLLSFCQVTTAWAAAPATSGQYCLVCDFAMTPESAKEGHDNACDDLFGASCLTAEGEQKTKDRSKSYQELAEKRISDARDKTARELGFKDFDDALKARLNSAGLELNKNPDSSAWKRLKRENYGSGSFSESFSKKLFSSASACYQEQAEIEKATAPSSKQNETTLAANLKRLETVQAKYQEKLISLYAMDIPTFMSRHIRIACTNLKEASHLYKQQDNQEAVKACQNLALIRRQAGDIYRSSESPDYKKRAEKFVRDNLIPDLKSTPNSLENSSGDSNAGGSPPDIDPSAKRVAKMSMQIASAKLRMPEICSTHARLLENAANKVYSDLIFEINTAKTTVDSLVDAYYGDGRRKTVTRAFDEARADIQRLVSRLVTDPKKRQKIVTDYDSLKFQWLEKPDDSRYTKNKNGLLVLDVDKGVPKLARSASDDVYSIFSDPSLSFFSVFDAHYLPDFTIGQVKTLAHVSIKPIFVQSLDSEPYSFLQMLAHETGHQIGPEISKVNGYDLSPEFRKLLLCYKSDKSIAMKDSQADEVIAEYISSEVLASQISQLPPEKRRQALLSSMEAFCSMEEDEMSAHRISFEKDHPAWILRVAGVIGANPNLRKVIGCKGESPRYKSCGLDVSAVSSEALTALTVLKEKQKPSSRTRSVK